MTEQEPQPTAEELLLALPPKQQRFVLEYLACLNATEAARRADYAHPNKQGPRLLVNVGIARVIQAALEAQAMTLPEVAARLSEQARADLRAFLETDGAGKVTGFNLGKDRPLHLLKKVQLTETEFKGVITRTTTIELNDPQSALVHLGKWRGMFRDLSLNIPLDKLTDEQLARIAAGEDPLKVAGSG